MKNTLYKSKVMFLNKWNIFQEQVLNLYIDSIKSIYRQY